MVEFPEEDVGDVLGRRVGLIPHIIQGTNPSSVSVQESPARRQTSILAEPSLGPPVNVVGTLASSRPRVGSLISIVRYG